MAKILKNLDTINGETYYTEEFLCLWGWKLAQYLLKSIFLISTMQQLPQESFSLDEETCPKMPVAAFSQWERCRGNKSLSVGECIQEVGAIMQWDSVWKLTINEPELHIQQYTSQCQVNKPAG